VRWPPEVPTSPVTRWSLGVRSWLVASWLVASSPVALPRVPSWLVAPSPVALLRVEWLLEALRLEAPRPEARLARAHSRRSRARPAR